MGPGFAGIGGAIDTISDRKVGSMQPFAAGHVHHVAIGGRHCDCADRLRVLPVENGIPGASIICRFPNSAIDLANIEDIRLIRDARSGASATPTKRADHAPVHIRHRTVVFCCQASGAGKKQAGQQQDG